MKSRHIILILTFMLTQLCGCERDGQLYLNDNQSITMQSVEALSEFAQTPSPLPIGTQLGVFGSADGGVPFYAQNLKYIATENILAADAEELKFPQGATSATVCAYAPYTSATITNNLLPISVEMNQNANGTASSNIMWSKAVVSKSSGVSTLEMERKMTLLRINISSAAAADISAAKVEVINVLCKANLSLIDGTLQPTTAARYSVEARRISNGKYEAVILPQSFNTATDFIRVTVGNKSYKYQITYKSFEAAKAYTFDINVQDKSTLKYTLIVKYDSRDLDKTLTLPAKVADKDFDLNSIPTPPPYYHTFRIRNKSSEACWAKIIDASNNHKEGCTVSDAYLKLRFEENFGAERTMTLEFYDSDSPGDVYKSIEVTQLAATNYLTLSKQSFAADRMGTIYDASYEVDVNSNLDWTIENATDWIAVKYSANVKNQMIYIDVDINQTGVQRSGELRFMSGGTVAHTLKVTQSPTQSPTFTLRYEVNLDITSFDNWFQHHITNYADDIEIFNYYPNEFGDATAKLISTEKYGFVVDAPSSFNRMVAKGLRDDKILTYRNYSGSAATIGKVQAVVLSRKTSYPFFRAFSIDVPIPSGVKRNQTVVFSFKIVDTEHMLIHPKAEVGVEIVDRVPKVI